jgi:hypothetical protein
VPSLTSTTGNRKVPQARPTRRFSWGRVGAALGRGIRRTARPLAGLAVAGALAGGGLAAHRFVMTSPRFELREISVEGAVRLSRDKLLALAAVQPGGSVFALSVRAIEERLLASPWIAEAEARRRLPDGLTVRVVERRPAALLVLDGAGLYLADASGRPFKRADVHRGEGAGLVVVSGLERRLYADGHDPEAVASLVRHAIHVAALWTETHARPALGEIHLDRTGITLHTLEGAVAIALGRPEDDEALRLAVSRFDAIWGALPPDERAAARRIHLDSRTRPDRVTVSLAAPEEKR